MVEDREIKDAKNSNDITSIFTKNNIIVIGALWNLLYYGFVVGILPELDVQNILVLIIAIFSIGLIVMIFLTLPFLAPGLLLRGFSDEHFKSWLKGTHKIYKVDVNNRVLLFSGIFLVSLGLLFLLYAIREGITTVSLLLPVIIIIVGLILRVILPGIPLKSSLIPILFALVTFLITTFSLYLLFYDTAIGKVIVTSGIVIFIPLFIFIVISYLSPPKDLRPFSMMLSIPYSVLKIGQVDAYLTLDNDFVKEAKLERRLKDCEGFDEQGGRGGSQRIKLKVMDSIGTQYIV